MQNAEMLGDYDISLGRPEDIPDILVLQEANLAEAGGGLTARQTADWFRHAILEKSLVVGRTERKVIAYVLGTSLAAKAHVMVVQTMLRNFPPPSRLLSLWPGLCCRDAARKGACKCSFPSTAKTHGWPTSNDLHTSRQHSFVT